MTDAAALGTGATEHEETRAARDRRRTIIKRILKWTAITTAAALLGLLVFLTWSTRRPFPQIEGEIALAGLDDRVEIIRDDHGIPHLYASTTHDLFFAQGFVHAQDRFWQMDTWRHIGAGRLSEMFGADQFETDAFIRTMGWYELATRQYAALGTEDRGYLDAYAEGVNAYLAMRSPAELGFEYTILEFINHSYDPEPWSPVDTLVWGKVMAWDLRGNIDSEIDRALLLGTLPEGDVDLLYPAYPDHAPTIVDTGPTRVTGPAIDPPPIAASTAALRRIAANAERIDALTGGGGDGLGSNSWVVAGSHTSTGTPILANDPHLGIRIPSIWYQIGLHCRERSPDCPFDVAGFSFAGVPGVIIGHNDRIAWGFTNLGPDVMDLYIERVNPDDPHQYEVDGEWVDMEVHTETIAVAGGSDRTIEVRATRHGPVISDVFGRLDDFDTAGVDLPESYVVALQWTALQDTPPLTDTIFGLNTARDWNDFRSALSSFSVPAQNAVYADVAGNIGYQAPGLIPIRSAGDGRLPVPGWSDTHRWTGFIPFRELPTVFNPPAGWIVTANNAVIDGSYRHFLTSDWNLGDRASRLVELIDRADPLSVEDMAELQFDSFNLTAERVRPLFTALDRTDFSGLEHAAMALLADWDLHNRADSEGAAVFEAAWAEMLDRTFGDDLPDGIEPNGGARWSLALAALGDDPDARLWDDQDTATTETRDDVARAAFAAAVVFLEDTFGDDPEDWEWGDLHTATFENETLGRSGVGLIEAQFNRGPYPTSGGFDIVNATGWTPSEGFVVDWVPSFRMIVDLGDLAASRWANTTGASGHTHHPHYDDQIARWRAGNNYPMLWDRAAIEAAAEGTLILTPAE